MKKSEFTKNKIIKESSQLFNLQGYKNTSISEITDATGFTKGAIYRHFENKEDLEIKSFEYLSSIVLNTLKFKIKNAGNAIEKLEIIFKFFRSYNTNPIIQGGCPLLNVAIEVDETNSTLRKRAISLLDTLKMSIEHIIEKGVEYQQFKPNINATNTATIIVASLEGAIMTSKLKNTNDDLTIVCNHLMLYLEQYKL